MLRIGQHSTNNRPASTRLSTSLHGARWQQGALRRVPSPCFASSKGSSGGRRRKSSKTPDGTPTPDDDPAADTPSAPPYVPSSDISAQQADTFAKQVESLVADAQASEAAEAIAATAASADTYIAGVSKPQLVTDPIADAISGAVEDAAETVVEAVAVAEAVAEATAEAFEVAEAVAEATAATTVAAFAEATAEAAAPFMSPSPSGYAGSSSYPSYSPGSSSAPADPEKIETVKVKLLAALASLDRGIAANVQEAKEVDALAAQLEQLGGAVKLAWTTSEQQPDVSTMEMLNGTWRLVYSSGFNTGSLGGRRPGPPAALVPTILGQVYQRIDSSKAHLDNIVEFLFTYPIPQLPWSTSQPESPALRLTLRHDYEVTSDTAVRIVYEDTYAQFVGAEWLSQLPKFEFPSVPDFLKPPRDWRAATFDVSFLDAGMRVTRGDRGELRVYLKDADLDPVAPKDYED